MRDEAHNSANLDAVEADDTAADEADSAASGSTVVVDTDDPLSGQKVQQRWIPGV